MLMNLIRNRYVVFLHDATMVIVAWIGAYWLRFNLEWVPASLWDKAIALLPLLIVIQLPIFYGFGLYRGVWRYASMKDLERIVRSILAGTFVFAIAVFVFYGYTDVPRSVFPLYSLLLGACLSLPRFIYRQLKDVYYFHPASERVLILGAGEAGESLLRDLLRQGNTYYPIGFLDDNAQKRGLEIHGVRVIDCIDAMESRIAEYRINMVLIAIPSATSMQMRRIVDLCERCGVKYFTLPSLAALTSGQVSVDALRKVSLEDLLGREEVTLDWSKLSPHFSDLTIMVTGGGGSIGSELCRQLVNISIKKLIIVENNEFNLHQIEVELAGTHFPVEYYLESVNDRQGIRSLLKKHQPDIIFHAAAFKHVPILERQPRLAVMNNILGTQVCAEEAVIAGVKQFILISTDKAVRPTSYLGMTKRICELLCQSMNSSQTRFTTVRFGNVLGSTGSVVPLFKQQIVSGDIVTVTHPDVERYFMTIPEACRLILQATTQGAGGDVFVLDMGEPIKIRYLAEQLIRLSGKTLGKDINILYTGLRPGEKLQETLFYHSEDFSPTEHSKILKAHSDKIDNAKLKTAITELAKFCDLENTTALIALLQELVSDNYFSNNDDTTQQNVVSLCE